MTINTSAKGARMERLATSEFIEWFQDEPVRQWRSVRVPYQNNDFLNAFDVVLLFKPSRKEPSLAETMEVRLQVKPGVPNKYLKELNEVFNGYGNEVLQYLAVYGHKPRCAYEFETKHFWFVRVGNV